MSNRIPEFKAQNDDKAYWKIEDCFAKALSDLQDIIGKPHKDHWMDCVTEALEHAITLCKEYRYYHHSFRGEESYQKELNEIKVNILRAWSLISHEKEK